MNDKEQNNGDGGYTVPLLRKLFNKVVEEVREDPRALIQPEKLRHGAWGLIGILNRVFLGPVGPELPSDVENLEIFSKGGGQAQSLSSDEELLLVFLERGKKRSECIALLFPEGSGVGFTHPRFPQTFAFILEGNSCLVAGLQSSQPVLNSEMFPGQGCQFTPLAKTYDKKTDTYTITKDSRGNRVFSRTHGGLLIDLVTGQIEGYGIKGEESLISFETALERAQSRQFMLMIEGIHIQTGMLNKPFDVERYKADPSQFNGIGYFQYTNPDGRIMKRIFTLTFYNPKVSGLARDFGSDNLASKIGVKGGVFSGHDIHNSLNKVANELSKLGNQEISWTFVATEYNHGGTTYITGDKPSGNNNPSEKKPGNKGDLLFELTTGHHQGLLVISKNGPPHRNNSPESFYINEVTTSDTKDPEE